MHRGRIVADGTVDEVIARAAIGDRVRVRVRVDDVTAAAAALDVTTAVRSVRFDNTRPGDIDIDLATIPSAPTIALRALLDAGVEPRSFDLDGSRLSDAFLALTAQPEATIR